MPGGVLALMAVVFTVSSVVIGPALTDLMVPHHQGAIAMANVLLKKGEQPALRKIANDVVGSQSKEITQMRGWLKAWYGSSSESDHGMDNDGHGSDDTMDRDG